MPTAYTLLEHADLAGRNTLRVAARARWLATVYDASVLPQVLSLPELADLPSLVLGEGSNVLFAADYPGVMLQLATTGIAFESLPDGDTRVSADAGARWDTLVTRTLAAGCAGIENLALIPGLVGAAPIQNIGAYGVELDECLESVEVLDRVTLEPGSFGHAECRFSYRDSRFKHEPDRWIVTRVHLRLSARRDVRLDYAGVREELGAMGVDDPAPAQVAEAVRQLRRRKLPDPAAIGNAGSFFKNPIVARHVAETLQAAHPALPAYPAPDATQRKLSAAWLIESCGWRGWRERDAGISGQHALVLVNHGRATGEELLDLARRVAASVEVSYGICLEPEPRIVGATF